MRLIFKFPLKVRRHSRTHRLCSKLDFGG